MGCSAGKQTHSETNILATLTDPNSHIDSILQKKLTEKFQSREKAITQKYKNKQENIFAEFLSGKEKEQEQSEQQYQIIYNREYKRIENDCNKECQQAIQECQQNLKNEYEENKKVIKEVLLNLINTQYQIQNDEYVKENLNKSKQSTTHSSGKEEVQAQPPLAYPNLQFEFQQLPEIEISDEKLKKALQEYNNREQ